MADTFSAISRKLPSLIYSMMMIDIIIKPLLPTNHVCLFPYAVSVSLFSSSLSVFSFHSGLLCWTISHPGASLSPGCQCIIPDVLDPDLCPPEGVLPFIPCVYVTSLPLFSYIVIVNGFCLYCAVFQVFMVRKGNAALVLSAGKTWMFLNVLPGGTS